MPRIYKKNTTKHWSQKALQDALVDRKESGTSFRKLSEKYNIPRSSLERHVRAAEKGVSLTGQGRKLVFSPDEMQDLKKCIVALVSLSFGMRIKDVAQLVESYVQHNDHETGKSFKI